MGVSTVYIYEGCKTKRLKKGGAFMPREARIIPECALFHIMVRGNNKKRIFYKDCEFRYFKKILLFYKKKWKFLLYHYSLMRNHFHLSIQATKRTDISKMMQGLLLVYWNYYSRRYGHVGHLYQGRFQSKVIEDNSYLLNVALYIEANPVEAGIADNPIDYEWCSYKHYASGAEDPLIDPDPLYEQLSNTAQGCQRVYKELMQNYLLNINEKENCNG